MSYPPASGTITDEMIRDHTLDLSAGRGLVSYHDRPPTRLFNDVNVFARAIKSSLSHTKAVSIIGAHGFGISQRGMEKILIRSLEDHYPPAQYSREVAVVWR